MATQDLYEQFMFQLSTMGMMCPPRDALLKILKANFSKEEVKTVLAIPAKEIPLQYISIKYISKNSDLPLEDLIKILKRLSEKGLIFSCEDEKTKEVKYALQQSGFGFPQIFFWKGEDTPHSREMARTCVD